MTSLSSADRTAGSHQRHASSPISLSLTVSTSMIDPSLSTSSPSGRPASTRSSKSHNRDKLPPLFWYIEAGDWQKAEERIRRHPRDIKTWATLKTKADSSLSLSSGASAASSGGSKRLALHHACFKLRSAGSTPPPLPPEEDPFVQICRFILLLVKLYPEAAGERESRHGCLPLHLAAFASCASRQYPSMPSAAEVRKPPALTRRNASDGTSSTNMSAVHAEETESGAQCVDYRLTSQSTSVSVAARSENLQINARREEMAVCCINALLDAYPKAIRVDSEGGRLPLHTACAGRATPRVVATLVTAYPAAARHRNKDGFLPLHLAAHWGVSHPNVAITLLRTYPDATVGRNRWERTPLEEALCMAGENGRPHQSALVRALRKHPSFWTLPESAFALPRGGAPSMAVDVDESLPSNDDEERTNAVGRALLDDSFAQDEFGQEIAPISSLRVGSGGLIDRYGVPKKKHSDKSHETDLNMPMEIYVQNRNWRAVLEKIRIDPLEPEKELKVMTRGGFKASTGMTLLHYACERSPPVEIVQALIEAYPMACLTRCMPGGCLPLHVACTWYASPSVVRALLSADQGGAEVKDELGNLPLHSACFSGADFAIIEALVTTAPKAVLARNHQGSRPIDICKRLRHDNRDLVMQILAQKKREITNKVSSGNWAAVAKQAEESNRLEEEAEPGFEVEVTYNDGGQEQLHWI